MRKLAMSFLLVAGLLLVPATAKSASIETMSSCEVYCGPNNEMCGVRGWGCYCYCDGDEPHCECTW